MNEHRGPVPGRGAADNPPNRFERLVYQHDPEASEDDGPLPKTEFLRDASRTIIATNDSPDVGFEASVNPYRGCEHGCVYCLAPDTPILHADMMWRPLGDVQPGDQLVGFDEHPGPDMTRKSRRAVVQAVRWSKRPTLKVITSRTRVVTTANHGWLQAREFRWSCTHQLSRGMQLRYVPVSRDEAREMNLDPEPIEAVEPGPVADVVDIQTSTGTFYAAGLATHNCYARPTHETLGFSAGLDFETKILVKEDAPELLRRALAAKSWKPQPIALSGVTDPYQPVERRLRLTRRCLEVLVECRNPVIIVTKNHLVTRDADLLAELAAHDAALVFLSVTTLDDELQRKLEPRTSPPARRLAAIEALAAAGVPVGVMVAPVIPAVNDHEIPAILAAASGAGARSAGYVMLRLPHAVKDLFERWLTDHLPDRKEKVLHRIRELRDGRLNDPGFGLRMRGSGPFAEQVAALFALGCRRAGIEGSRAQLSTAAFRRPTGGQIDLFR